MAAPLLTAAGIKSTVIETKAQGHARSIVADMPLDTLQVRTSLSLLEQQQVLDDFESKLL